MPPSPTSPQITSTTYSSRVRVALAALYSVCLFSASRLYLVCWYIVFLVRVWRDGSDSAAWFQVTETGAALTAAQSLAAHLGSDHTADDLTDEKGSHVAGAVKDGAASRKQSLLDILLLKDTDNFDIRQEGRNGGQVAQGTLGTLTVVPRTNNAVRPRHVQLHTAHLPKRPKHVAVVVRPECRLGWFAVSECDLIPDANRKVGGNEVSNGRFRSHTAVDGGTIGSVLLEISRFACWCASAGIVYLTIYDEAGIIKGNARKLLVVLRKTENLYFESPESKLEPERARSRSRLYIANEPLEEEAATSTEADIYVNLISLMDGRPMLAKASANLSHNHIAQRSSVQQLNLEPSSEIEADFQLSVEALDKILDPGPVPLEPQLLYIFGGAPHAVRLWSYSPWAIRLSELCSVPGDGIVRYGGFLKGLYQYAYTDFRLGK